MDLLHAFTSFWVYKNCKALILMVLSPRSLLRIEYVATNSENKKKYSTGCTMGPYTAPGIALYKLLTFAIKGEEMYRKMIPTNMEIYMYKVFQCSIVFIVGNLLHPFTWRSCWQNCVYLQKELLLSPKLWNSMNQYGEISRYIIKCKSNAYKSNFRKNRKIYFQLLFF